MAVFHTKAFIKHDDYMTPKYAWEWIEDFIPKDKVIWEAFYGDGESGKFLSALGFNVIHEETDFFTNNLGDVIVSNPPYINKLDLNKLDNEVKNYEPKLALNGVLGGLSVIRKVIKKSSELIKKRGKFILEIGFDQKNKVIKLLNKEGFYINSAIKDLAYNDRCIICTKI